MATLRKSEIDTPLPLRSLSVPKWNDIVILFLTTHGNIVRKDEKLNTFEVPEGITIKRCLATSPGECNFALETQVDEYSHLITQYKPDLLSARELTRDDALETIMRAIKRLDRKHLRNIRARVAEIKREIKKTDEDDENMDSLKDALLTRQGYIRHFEDGFTVQTFREGDTILNKKYERDNNTTTKTDWVINVMNIRGHPDLFSFLHRQTRSGTVYITLEEMVNFLKSKGVKEIILFDFSCSNMVLPDKTDIDLHTVRRERLHIKESKLGGKKTRKGKNPKKQKRAKTMRK